MGTLHGVAPACPEPSVFLNKSKLKARFLTLLPLWMQHKLECFYNSCGYLQNKLKIKYLPWDCITFTVWATDGHPLTCSKQSLDWRTAALMEKDTDGYSPSVLIYTPIGNDFFLWYRKLACPHLSAHLASIWRVCLWYFQSQLRDCEAIQCTGKGVPYSKSANKSVNEIKLEYLLRQLHWDKVSSKWLDKITAGVWFNKQVAVAKIKHTFIIKSYICFSFCQQRVSWLMDVLSCTLHSEEIMPSRGFQSHA